MTLPTATNYVPTEPPPAAPKRPTGLTAWLVVLIVFNTLSAIVVGAILNAFRTLAPSDFSTDLMVFGPSLLSTVNVVCAVALLKNKKWGFWGLCASAFLSMLAIYPIGGGIPGALAVGLFGFIGVGILYSLLTAGEPDTRTWPRLH